MGTTNCRWESKQHPVVLMRYPGLAGAAVILLLLPACSPQTEDDPWRETILAAGQEADTEFERQVLSDGKITEDEFREAIDREISCFEDNGIIASYVVDEVGNGQFMTEHHVDDDERYNEVTAECGALSDDVQFLYDTIRRNPKNEDPRQLAADCLVENGIAAEGLTGEEYFKAIEDVGVFDPNLPWDVEHAAYMDCITLAPGR